MESKGITIEEAKKDFDLIKRALNKRRLCPCGYCVSDQCVPRPNECLKDDFVINVALEALEKQIPKKPKETETAYNVHWFHDCPSCGKTQEDDEGEWFWYPFCPFCGQRLEWEND